MKTAWVYSVFLLASVDVAAQAVAASLAREITQSCSLGYTHPAYFPYTSFSFCACLFCMTRFIRGSEPSWSVDYRRLCTYTALQIIDKSGGCDSVTGLMLDI